MNDNPPRILIVDDEESICWGLSKLCSQMSIECETASSAEEGLRLAAEHAFQTIVMDVRLPGMDGLTAIQKFQDILGPVPVITITAFGDLQTAIQSVQSGAFEYIVKPFELDTVKRTITQALAVWKLSNHRPEVEASPAESSATPNSPNSPNGLIGSSAIMQEVFKQIALTTTTDSPVLITGESGTGKELTARAIHRFSNRADGPFVAVNIASLNPTLAESELFGHTKGSFTGADSARVGLIQQASGGTLFLDEVAEIPLEIQVKLLRVLDQGEVTPVGSNQPVKTNFRLLSATHQDLLSQVNHGDFRHDLFYRLRTFEIQLPPLRDHREDIPALTRHFLSENLSSAPSLSLSEGFLDALKRRPWPGNVRELRSVVERAAILARGGVLTSDHIEDAEIPSLPAKSASTESDLKQLAVRWLKQNWDADSGDLRELFLQVVEPAIYQTAFELSNQQYSAASKRLGIHRTTLKKKLEDFTD